MQENKSLEQLENDYWKDIDFPTTLVKKCHALRKVPLNQLSLEQVRLLLGQRLGTVYLIPIALQFLNENILAEGDFYPGDLLSNVLDLPPEDWRGNEQARIQLTELLNINKEAITFEGNRQLTRKVESYLQDNMRTTERL